MVVTWLLKECCFRDWRESTPGRSTQEHANTPPLEHAKPERAVLSWLKWQTGTTSRGKFSPSVFFLGGQTFLSFVQPLGGPRPPARPAHLDGPNVSGPWPPHDQSKRAILPGFFGVFIWKKETLQTSKYYLPLDTEHTDPLKGSSQGKHMYEHN